MCEAFGCTPSEALQQDPQLVLPILEYRLAQSAKEQHGRDASKMTEAQVRLFTEMARLLEEIQGG